MITLDGMKNTSRRWDLWLEVRSLIGGDTSNQRLDLQLEVRSPIGGPTSNQRWHLQSEVRSSIRGEISNWRSHLQSEVTPPIGGTHVTCRNQLFFWKKRDYLLLITSSHHLSTRWNVNLLFIGCTAIHNYSSSGSLVFTHLGSM